MRDYAEGYPYYVGIAKVLMAIEKYFSPSIWFYSLQQMFDKGYKSEEIFEGPILENGFIDIEELKNADLRTEVRLSDIMNIIMGIDGVNFIKEITIIDCNNPEDEENTWNICVEDGKKLVLCHKSTFNYFKGVLK